jgi:hypothetical protein
MNSAWCALQSDWKAALRRAGRRSSTRSCQGEVLLELEPVGRGESARALASWMFHATQP